MHGEHLFATSLEGGQQSFEFFLAHLAEEVFELLLGLLKIADCSALLVARVLVVAVGDLLFSFFHLIVAVFNLLLAGGVVCLLAARRRRLAAVSALGAGLRRAFFAARLGRAFAAFAGLRFALLPFAAFTTLAGLGFAGLAVAAF